MKKIFCFILIIFAFSSKIYSLEVDVDELKKLRKVKFINYKGPHGKIDSISDVRYIGSKLALGSKKLGNNSIYKYYNKYSIIHAVSENEKDKFSADIFSIDKKAKVNHIKYIRHIMSGYLQNRYKYSKIQADTLALYLSYYNAIYRGNMDYMRLKYKTVVVGHINKNNAGISVRYNEWIGKTKILIPLTKETKRGKIDSIDPFLISDDKIKEAVRKDDNIDKRKEMVKLKEEDVDKSEKDLDKEKEKLDKLKKEVDKEKELISKDKSELDKNNKDLTTEESLIEKDKLKDREKEVKQKEEALKKSDDLIKKREEEIIVKKKDIEKEKRDIRDDEMKKGIGKDPKGVKESLDRRIDTLRKKEEELDKREDRLRDKKTDKNIFGNSLYYLKIKEYLKDGHYNNELSMIHAPTGKVVLRASDDSICGRRYDIFSEGIVVIAHTGDHKSEHRLTLLDRKTLKPKKKASNNVFWRSFIEIKEGFVYAIILDKNEFYLGKYDKDLNLTSKSEVPVGENTFISFYQEFIYINSRDSGIIVLNKSDLKKVSEIRP
ncbi:MAG: hypothetical protein OEV44_07145 [Spirochaetota bacterium]|nr:hypothetical protein [Spirochaetota bacterium]